MTDREFYLEIRKGLLIIMRAMMRKYGLSWVDFQPRETASALYVDVNPK